MKALTGLLLSLACLSAVAAELDALEVGHEDRRYRMNLAARLDAPLQASYAAFRDYRNLPRINDAVEYVELLGDGADGTQRVFTRVRVCIWRFCTRLEQVQDIRESAEGDVLGLDASVLPERSNLRYGSARWRLRECGAQTCLDFEAALEPAFWVPPLIGPWAIERAMRREALDTAFGIERIARAAAGT